MRDKDIRDDPMNIIKLYFCYAPEDKSLQNQLLRHLSWLIQSGQVIAHVSHVCNSNALRTRNFRCQ